MLHAARQLPAWLIFDVRQRKSVMRVSPLLGLLLMLVAPLGAAEIVAEAVVSRGPVRMQVVLTRSEDALSVACTVQNTSAATIPFILASGTRGFSMEMRDAAGQRVAFTPDGKKRFRFIDEQLVGNVRRAELRPKDRAVVVERLTDIFSSVPLGAKVRVQWASGYPSHHLLIAEIAIPKSK